MDSKHKLDSQDPHYQEGRRMALELKLDRVLAEARSQAADEYSSSLRSNHRSEQNMERLSNILMSYPSAEPQKSSASSWSFRQQKASERWKEARPYHLKCLIAKEAVGHPLCCLCHEPAVIRCRECLPEEWFCGDCDVLHHKKQPLHNRECIIHGFFQAIPPTSHIIKGQDGYCIHEQACILPTVKVLDCSCDGTNFTILPGKPVILITINGWNQNSCGNDEITLNLTPCDPMEISATVEQMSPVVELISPVVEQMSPVVEQVNPVVEQMSPVVEQMSPVVEQMKAAQRTVLKEVVTKDCAEGSGLAQ
ncbi:hypothetical protein ROHU_034165 [Labeo rohita]|uniref:Uncharacterized protein n=1 Tax=Labeo rohita TaxID=84645 RepID=A0A498LCD2_LABRO|nr:hypothetical protein ROHU_034165 [Labeo rohita]